MRKIRTDVSAMAVVLAVVVCCLGKTILGDVNYPVGTFLIHGLAENERKIVLGLVPDDEALRMQAVATNGTVLAECSFTAPTSASSPDNFLLEVPMTRLATDDSAAVNDTVQLCLVKNGEPKAVLSEPIRLYSATGTTNLVAQLYETVSYTNKDGRVATLPADYVRGLGVNYPGQDAVAAYDPFADSDGDGVSNYGEYLAATNPFDPNERLSIRAFERSPDRVKLTFEYVGGVVYGVSASPSLEPQKADWKEAELATEPAQAPSARRMLLDADVQGVGRKTFYLLPTEKADSMFYRLEVK